MRGVIHLNRRSAWPSLRDAGPSGPVITYRRILEDMNRDWRLDQIEQVRQWWVEGVPLGEMAERLKRDPDEVALLIMHLARQGELEPRPGGCFGTGLSEQRGG